VAQVDRQVDLVRLCDLINISILFHIYGHELIADLRRVFSIIHRSKLFGAGSLGKLRIIVNIAILTLNKLLPSNIIEALAEEDDISQQDLVEHLIDLTRSPEKVERENFINQHVNTIVICQVVIATFPRVLLRF